MAKHTDRVRIEEVDWPAVLPWLRLLGAPRAAMHPSKLLTALLLVVLLFGAGKLLDLAAGPRVHAGEFDAYRETWFGLRSQADFDRWLAARPDAERVQIREALRASTGFTGDAGTADRDFGEARRMVHDLHQKAYSNAQKDRELLPEGTDWDAKFQQLRSSRRQLLRRLDQHAPRGAFDAALTVTLDSFDRLVRGVATLNFGWSQTVSVPPSPPPAAEDAGADTAAAQSIRYYDQSSLLSALTDLFLILPAWLWERHRGVFLALLSVATLLVALFGGAVTRMAAMHGARDERIGPRAALGFVLPRAWSFVLAPILPLAIVLAVAVLMGAGGFILFSPKEWGIDIFGGLFFFAAILCGFIIAATVVLSALGVHLVYPAIAVDGADVFDGYARAFHYVLNRAGRWLFFVLVVLLLGSMSLLVLSLVLFLTLWAVHQFVGMWAATATDMGETRWDVLLPKPGMFDLAYRVDYASLDWSSRVAAFFIRCWTFLAIALLPAFAISYYFTANTWIYLLLRRSADGIETDDVAVGSPDEPKAVAHAPDKVEPDSPRA